MPLAQLPATESSDNLPAMVGDEAKPGTSLIPTIPTIPDVTKAAARWLRPFVPPIIATAIDTTTKPLRSARQVFEETEEIHISLRRSHRVSVQSEEHESVVAAADRQQVTTPGDRNPELHALGGPRQLPPAQ